MAALSWFLRLFNGNRKQPEIPGGFTRGESIPPSAASPAPLESFLGPELEKEYFIEGKLGEGGMGEVFLVRARANNYPYALKRAFIAREQDRRNFEAELRTWIDLPVHHHFAACLFFRTVKNQIFVFAEYLPGGALEQWIRDRRLYAGGPAESLKRILDIAIQFAWALHAVHALGLVHQDVKPGNVLMTADGMPKVADFGLTRARAAAGETRRAGPGGDPLVSCGGCSLAYCSPEQYEGRRLTKATDVWSWGLSVLEMFTGTVFWPYGIVALEALQAFLGNRPQGYQIPPMPAGVTDVLRRCFRAEPCERWATLEEAAGHLAAVYREATGTAYTRQMRPLPQRSSPSDAHDRRTTGGAQWDDPRIWLEKALKAAGREPAEAWKLLPSRTGSRQAQALADLSCYEEARRIYEQLLAGGRTDVQAELAALYFWKALVHGAVKDVSGELACYDRAIEVCERLVRAGHTELEKNLAAACMNKATALGDMGDLRGAVALYDRAIQIRQRLVGAGRTELEDALAAACLNKANALNNMNDLRGAVPLHDRAIGIYERLVRTGRTELENNLARACMNKAVALTQMGDLCGAVALYDRSIEIYERLVRAGRTELENDLARACMNKATALSQMGDQSGAVALYDRAIEISGRLVRAGRTELENELADACMNKATALWQMGDLRGAVALYDRSIEICERLVRAGRRELKGDLAWAVLNRCNVLYRLGDTGRAREEARKAVVALKDELARNPKADLAQILTWAQKNMADLL